MSYGELKIDTITFTAGGVDASVSVSGLVQNPTFTGNITTTGTISGDVIKGNTISGVNVIGTTEVSGATVTGNVGLFGTITGGIHTLTSGVFASGTAANPSITFVDDLNTGIYSPGADQVAISTSGTERLRIASDGKLGVGTTSPSAKLQVGAVGVVGGLSPVAYFVSDTNASGDAETEISIGQSGTSVGSWVALGAGVTSGASPYFFIKARPNAGGNSVERLRIDGSGNVGIGTASPDAKLHVATAGNNYIVSHNNTGSTSALLLGAESASTALYSWTTVDGSTGVPLKFFTGALESMRLDTSGRLLVGSNTSYSLAGFESNVQNHGTDASTASITVSRWSDDVGASRLLLGKSRGGLGAYTVVQDDDEIGNIEFCASDGTDLANRAASIGVAVDGTPGGNEMPGRLVLSTNPGTTGASPTERMRIDSLGRVTTGTTAASNGSTMLQGYYSDPNYINVIGSQFSTAATNICYAVRPSVGSAGYVSSAGNTSFPRGVIELDSNCAFKFASSATVAVGTAVTLTETARFTTDGLTFNGDTAAANALDDYEEGLWTPTVGGTATYTSQVGRYTKIGRMVHLVGVLVINTIGTGSQNTVSGLPFTNGTSGQATVNINYYSSSNATTTWIAGYVEPSTSYFRFSGNDGNATTADSNISFLTASTAIYFSLTYQV